MNVPLDRQIRDRGHGREQYVAQLFRAANAGLKSCATPLG
jgi:hypothetical protein